jgi:hypothetical protein
MTRKERKQMYAGTLFLDQRPSDATADTIEKAFLHWLSKRYDGVQPVFAMGTNNSYWQMKLADEQVEFTVLGKLRNKVGMPEMQEE